MSGSLTYSPLMSCEGVSVLPLPAGSRLLFVDWPANESQPVIHYVVNRNAFSYENWHVELASAAYPVDYFSGQFLGVVAPPWGGTRIFVFAKLMG